MNKTLLEFPCQFTIKVVGYNKPEFKTAVFSVIHQLCPKFSDTNYQTKTSKGDKYLSFSLTLPIDNKKQLDAIYTAITKSEHVVMAL